MNIPSGDAPVGTRRTVEVFSPIRKLFRKPPRTLTFVKVAPKNCVMCWGEGAYWDGDHDGSWVVACDHWVKEGFAPGGEYYNHWVLQRAANRAAAISRHY